jgi:uncharacterized tellurite resistance protein B-like protein
MRNTIKRFFEKHLAPAPAEDSDEHRLRLATEALLVSLTAVDDEVKEEERRAVAQAVRARFDLSRERRQRRW